MRNELKLISLILSLVIIFSVFSIVPFSTSAAVFELSESGATPDEANLSIKVGETKSLYIKNAGDEKYLEFVPEKDMYILFRDVTDALYSVRLSIYNSNRECLKQAGLFRDWYDLSYYVTAGKTYYLGVCWENTNTMGEIKVELIGAKTEIHDGSTVTVDIINGGDTAYLYFIPDRDMYIDFYSESTGSTFGCMYFQEKSGNSSSEGDVTDGYSGNGNNFKIRRFVYAGSLYFLGAKYKSNTKIGSFSVTLKEAPVWEYEQLGDNEVQITYYKGKDVDVVIPSEIDGYTVTSIGKNAFTGNNFIVKVEMPDTISYIDYDDLYGVFGNCRELTEIKLSNSLKSIPTGAFAGCSKLEKILLPDHVTKIGEYAFEECFQLREVRFPQGLLEINSCAFAGCYNLTNIVIPNTVEEIGEGAFASCEGEITIGYGVNEIGYEAFGYAYMDGVKSDDLIIKGYSGSVAEEYAKEHGFTFVSIGQAPPKPTLSFTPKYPYEYIENYNGYWETDDFDGTKSFVYYPPSFEDGDKLSITYADERGTIDYYFDGYDFEDNEGTEIYWENVERSKGYGWSVGGDNTFTITYKNMTVEVPVKLVKPENALIHFIPAKPFELIENREGYMADDYYIYYMPDFINGDQIIVDYGDKTVPYTYSSNYYGFIDENGQKISYGQTSDQDHTPWTIGSDNYFILTAAGKTTIVPVTIIEYPVESIEFELVSPIILYENQDGYYYDEEGRYLDVDENGCYYYDHSGDEPEKVYTEPAGFEYIEIPVYKDGNRLIIHNKDGSTKILTQRFVFTEEDHGYFFVDENGDYDFDVRFVWGDQETRPFKLGSDNHITVRYLDNTTEIPVTVVENNIESIEYQPIKPIVYNLNDQKDVYFWRVNQKLVYSYNPERIRETGSILTAHFKDGTTKKYTIFSTSSLRDGKYYPVKGSRYWAVDEEGSVIGYSSLKFDYNTLDWSMGNTYDITVSYLGATTKVPVTITGGAVVEPILGDVDGDGTVTIIDATMIQRRLASLPTAAYNEAVADVDGDGDVTVVDATTIQRYLAGLTADENIGKQV